jgi:hypothetical protein
MKKEYEFDFIECYDGEFDDSAFEFDDSVCCD